ncbi:MULTISPECIES: transmembrane sensor/regulator PpyR [unclassified Pseudomonas]|uniref:transmembrane sensor/regulator PpyR n=1 Tax=unclassified Pseudomonas TaxID=196821 RepID=UPI000EDF526A|nr:MULTISPECIES: transmembrane sensor/regulator PpyR [unclassified Pseudomonas]HBZ92516.1 transmembrane sensor/regulator PpyR [Pseudomonas sp.]
MYPLNLPPMQILHLSSQLLWAGLVLLLLGVLAAYGLERHLNVPTLVLAHSLTLIGPSVLKIGYVLRLIAQERLKERASAHAIA